MTRKNEEENFRDTATMRSVKNPSHVQYDSASSEREVRSQAHSLVLERLVNGGLVDDDILPDLGGAVSRMPELLVTSVALSDVDIEQFETCSRSTGNSKGVLMIKKQYSLVCSKLSIEVPNAIASASHTTLGFSYSLSTYMSFSFPNKQRSHCRKQNWFFLSHLSVGRSGSYAPIYLKNTFTLSRLLSSHAFEV
jgi:hypothetical protein